MLAELELELIEEIEKSLLGPRLKEKAVLPRLTPEIVKTLAPTAPAVYVAARDLLVNGARTTVKIDILCLARNARGHVEKLHGDGQTIGLYQILSGLLALTGPGSTHGFKAIDARMDRAPEWEAAGLAAASLTVEVSAIVPAEIDAASLAPFLLFHAEHSLVAGENEPAAIDEVPLPQ